MLKMIIVEDEKLEREGLVDFFDWNSMEIEIVGTACDGIEGMELAEKTKPDIIITDIKMPGMNGLDMSKKVKQILPRTKVIILTGYDDFKFAKQAIGLSVSAYILKPIDEDELVSTVKNIVTECKKNQNTELILNKEHYNEKTKFFIELLQGKLQTEKLKEKSLDFGINVSDEAQLVIIAIKPIKEDDESFKRLNFEMKNMIKDSILFLVSNEEEKIIFICVNIQDTGNAGLNIICESIKKNIELRDFPCFMGIGTTVEGMYDIKESALAAQNALEYGLFWSDSGTFYYKDIVYNSDNNDEGVGEFITIGNKFSKQLMHAVGCSEEATVKELLKEIFEFINKNKNVDKKYIFNYLYNVIYETSLMLYSLDKNNQKGLAEKNDFGIPLLELKNLKLISEYTYDFFEKVIRVINEKRNNKDENIIKTVLKLTEERYMTGLSLKIIAAEVYLSPNYLGNIFKKYMGKSFNDYLCELRMEKAKELLKDSNKKISTVSKEIGIPNTSYFCMLFKNIYGMAPKEYQEIILRN